ncbi:hypothetical protein Dimus_030541, partial [Dionaea muscipula]
TFVHTVMKWQRLGTRRAWPSGCMTSRKTLDEEDGGKLYTYRYNRCWENHGEADDELLVVVFSMVKQQLHRPAMDAASLM